MYTNSSGTSIKNRLKVHLVLFSSAFLNVRIIMSNHRMSVNDLKNEEEVAATFFKYTIAKYNCTTFICFFMVTSRT
jgi:Mg/Co/Ni transporter MgtE